MRGDGKFFPARQPPVGLIGRPPWPILSAGRRGGPDPCPTRTRCISEAARCASCTPRRRPPAARGLRPHLHVRRRAADRDPRQGAGADRPRRLLVRPHPLDLPEPPLALRPDGRSTECRRLEMLPIECVVRGYLAGSGWKEYREDGRRSAGTGCPAGCVESDGCPSRSSRRPPRPSRPRREHHARAGAPTRRRRDAAAQPSASRSRSTVRGAARARPRHHHRRHQVRVRRSTGRAGSSWATRCSRRTRRASGRPTSTRPAAPQPSFDKQFVRDGCEQSRLEQARRPGPALPADVVAGTRARYVEAFERITGIGFADYVAHPDAVLSGPSEASGAGRP